MLLFQHTASIGESQETIRPKVLILSEKAKLVDDRKSVYNLCAAPSHPSHESNTLAHKHLYKKSINDSTLVPFTPFPSEGFVILLSLDYN